MARFAFVPPTAPVGVNALVGGGAPGQSIQPAGPGERVYNVPGDYTFTVPAGVSEVYVDGWGGGGGGAGGTAMTGAFAPPDKTYGGCGGVGGNRITGIVGGGLIVSGSKLLITVGAGGKGADNVGSGGAGAGGESSFLMLGATTIFEFEDGVGGTNGSPESQGKGSVGFYHASVINPVVTKGGDAAPNAKSDPSYGSAGATTPGGGAGGAKTLSGTGLDGQQPGGGGGGSSRLAPYQGGDGGDGLVRIVWPPPEGA